MCFFKLYLCRNLQPHTWLLVRLATLVSQQLRQNLEFTAKLKLITQRTQSSNMDLETQFLKRRFPSKTNNLTVQAKGLIPEWSFMCLDGKRKFKNKTKQKLSFKITCLRGRGARKTFRILRICVLPPSPPPSPPLSHQAAERSPPPPPHESGGGPPPPSFPPRMLTHR